MRKYSFQGMGGKISSYILVFFLLLATASAVTYYITEDSSGNAVESESPFSITYTFVDGKLLQEKPQPAAYSTPKKNYSSAKETPDYGLLQDHLEKSQWLEMYYDDDWRDYQRWQYNSDYWNDNWRYDDYWDDDNWQDDGWSDHDHNWRYPYFPDSFRHYYPYKYYRYNIYNDGDYVDYYLYKKHKKCFTKCFDDFEPWDNSSVETCRRSCRLAY